VKLLITEVGSDQVESAAAAARSLASSRIAQVESRAALARAHALGRLSAADRRRSLDILGRIWRDLQVSEFDEALSEDAGALVERHVLRGMDAIHLASALDLRRATSEPLGFATFDARLAAAAAREGLTVVPTL